MRISRDFCACNVGSNGLGCWHARSLDVLPGQTHCVFDVRVYDCACAWISIHSGHLVTVLCTAKEIHTQHIKTHDTHIAHTNLCCHTHIHTAHICIIYIYRKFKCNGCHWCVECHNGFLCSFWILTRVNTSSQQPENMNGKNGLVFCKQSAENIYIYMCDEPHFTHARTQHSLLVACARAANNCRRRIWM